MSESNSAQSITFETVREIALSFPGVEEGTTFGAPVFKVKKGMLACEAGHEPAGILAVKVGVMEAEFLIEAEPDIYYVTDHYRSWGGVLIRMSEISPKAFRHVFEKAWRRLANKRDVAAYDEGRRA
jgi:hypothetical protein